MERISQELTNWLVSKKVIVAEENDIYAYGIFQMMMNIFDTISILVLAILFHKVRVSLCYITCFCLLRKYAGGYHAKSVIGCYTASVGTAFIIFIIISYCRMPMAVIAATWLVSGIIVFLFAPVQNRNKELDEVERLVYRRKTIIIWIFQSTLIWVLYSLYLTEEAEGILFSNVLIACSMIIELIGLSGENRKE